MLIGERRASTLQLSLMPERVIENLCCIGAGYVVRSLYRILNEARTLIRYVRVARHVQ